MEMGKRSRGTPRIAIRLARRLRDYLTLSDKKSADLEMANLTLKNIGVDEAGLDRFCRSYLKSLISKFNGGPVGLNTLAASLGEEERTIETLYESYLIQSGFIERRPQGRFATPLAYQHLGEAMNHPPKSNKLFS